MKNTWKTVGLIAVAAGALYYPGLKLYQYIAKRRAALKNAVDEGEEHTKHILSSYLHKAKHKPHHRHLNGADHQPA